MFAAKIERGEDRAAQAVAAANEARDFSIRGLHNESVFSTTRQHRVAPASDNSGQVTLGKVLPVCGSHSHERKT
jgi:hypothetical protein